MNVLFRILNGKSRTLVFAVLVLALASFGADIFGFLRDRLLAATFGAGDALDTYYAGFRIPDLIFNFVALGMLSGGFLPLYSEFKNRNSKEGEEFAQNTLTVLAVMLVGIAAMAWVVSPWLMPLVAPGFSGPKLSQTIAVTRMLLLSPVLFGISGVLSAILQQGHRFLLFALAPMLYNAGIILGVLVFVPHLGVFGIVAGVVIGLFLHIGIQILGVVQLGFRFRPKLFPLHQGTQRLFRLGIPRTFQLVVNQLTLTGLTAIASSLAAGSVAVLSLADNLQAVPVGVIGISFATAAFPHFAQAALSQRHDDLRRMISETLARTLFLAAPAAMLFFVLRAQIVRVVLGAGAFSWEDTRLTAAVLGMFSFGIVAQALIPVLIRAFFALKDMVTPLLVTIVTAAVTVFAAAIAVSVLSGHSALATTVLSMLRVGDLGSATVVGIPFAIALGAILQALFLVLALAAQDRLRPSDFFGPLARIGAATFLSGFVVFVTLRAVAPVVSPQGFVTTLVQGAVAGCAGLAVYFGMAHIARFPELPALGEGIRQHFFMPTEANEEI